MRSLFTTVLIGWLAACQQQPTEPAKPPTVPLREQLAKTWILSDLKTSQLTASGTEAARRWKVRLLQAGVLFHLFPDGQCAFIEGEIYHVGQWTLDERSNKINCTYAEQDSSSTLSIKIRRLGGDSLVADLTRQEQMLSVILKTDNYGYSKPEKCPWHLVNNQWRIKPDHPETDGEIKARFINYLRHYCTLLEAMLDNNGQRVTVKNSPSCIQVYSSGIGMRNTDKIDAAWYATFYDRQDAKKCLIMFRKMLPDNGVITGPKTRNWVSDDLTILQRLMNRLQGEK